MQGPRCLTAVGIIFTLACTYAGFACLLAGVFMGVRTPAEHLLLSYGGPGTTAIITWRARNSCYHHMESQEQLLSSQWHMLLI